MQPVRMPRAPRLPSSGPVRVITERASIDCELVNISASGMLVRLPCFCKPTSRVKLSFRVEQARLRLSGEVARSCRVETAHAWGISFRCMPEDAKQLLSRYVRCKLASEGLPLLGGRQSEAEPSSRPCATQRPRAPQQPSAPRPQPIAPQPSATSRSDRRRAGRSARRRWAAANLERLFRSMPRKPREPEE